jgi:hypothetical protein
MKYLVKVTLGTKEANAAIRDGSIMEKTQRILDESKPEAAYFATENGRRTQYLVLNIDDPKQMPPTIEPWWLLFNADITVSPVFTLQDMEALGPVLKDIAKKWA